MISPASGSVALATANVLSSNFNALIPTHLLVEDQDSRVMMIIVIIVIVVVITHCFRLVAVAPWAAPAFGSLKRQLMALRGGSGSFGSLCHLILSETGDAAFGVHRVSAASSGDDGIRGGRGADNVFSNIIVISPMFLLHQKEAAVSATLATFNADSRFPRFFFVVKEGHGVEAQVALWGYVHASGTMLPLLVAACASYSGR